MKIGARLALAGFLFIGSWALITPAHAQLGIGPPVGPENIMLNQLTPELIKRIQTQWGADVGQCAIDQIQLVIKDYNQAAQWMIILDTLSPNLVVTSLDGVHRITCSPGMSSLRK